MLQIQTIGHLGKDAELAEWDGKKVINFSVANTESYKPKNGTETKITHWIECSFWTDSKIHEYLKKGAQVFIQGEMQVNLYEMPSGEKNYRINCRISKVQLLSFNKDEPKK
jgi:single-strand DNA-binding protein